MEIEIPDLICRICHTTLDVRTQTIGDTLVDFQYNHPPAYKILNFPEHDPDPVQARPFDERVGVCDFCAAPEPMWTYPATTFVMEHGLGGFDGSTSIGSWAACDTCHELIEADDYPALSERGTASQVQGLPSFIQVIVKAKVIEYHQQFKGNRIGDAINIVYGTPQ